MNKNKVGPTPERPSGADSIAIVIVDRLRTLVLMTINMAAIINGKTFTKATLAFSDSSMFPPISMRYPMGGREMKLLVSSTELKRF